MPKLGAYGHIRVGGGTSWHSTLFAQRPAGVLESWPGLQRVTFSQNSQGIEFVLVARVKGCGKRETFSSSS